MKNSLVIAVLILLSSATQAQKYSWNYMEIGYSDNGLGKGPTFSVASHVTGNLAMAELAGVRASLKPRLVWVPKTLWIKGGRFLRQMRAMLLVIT
jgi:hypothetical protein